MTGRDWREMIALAAAVCAGMLLVLMSRAGTCPQLPEVRAPSRVVVIGPSGRPADETDWSVLRGELAPRNP
jgi:hypothetical protein